MSPTTGQLLRNAREARALSLMDAAHETCIPQQRLQHLESDNYAAFGSMTYARAFLRAYSEYLQVDAHEVLEELPGGVLGGTRDYRYLVEEYGPWVGDKNERLRQPAPYSHHANKSPVRAGMVIFVLMLIGSWMWGSHIAEQNAKDTTQSVLPAVEDTALQSVVPVQLPPVSVGSPGVETAVAPRQDATRSAPKAVPLSEEEARLILKQKTPPRALVVE